MIVQLRQESDTVYVSSEYRSGPNDAHDGSAIEFQADDGGFFVFESFENLQAPDEIYTQA